MREQPPQYYVGLDVGTSTVRCIVGNLDSTSEEPEIAVIGHGSAANMGMRKGLVAHLDDVAAAVHQAIEEAERISGIRIENVTVNVNGSHVSGLDSTGVIAISAANREITIDDKLRAEDAATIVQIPANREIIQVFPKNYRVDGHESIKDPVGMRGVRLEVDTHIVTAATANLRSLEAVMEKVHIYPMHRTVAGLAAAEAVLSRQQKEAGSLVLDIGASTTNLAVIEDGEVQHVAVIPMGSINITNDLAIGLKVDLEIAEMVKLQHAALAGTGKNGRVSVVHESRNYVFDSEDVHMIVDARVDEIFDYIDKELRRIHRARKLPGGVVIVGGGANTPGIAAFAKEKLQLAARIGKLKGVSGVLDDVQDPGYVTAIGLMQLDMLFANQSFGAGSDKRQTRTSGLVDSLRGIWNKVQP